MRFCPTNSTMRLVFSTIATILFLLPLSIVQVNAQQPNSFGNISIQGEVEEYSIQRFEDEDDVSILIEFDLRIIDSSEDLDFETVQAYLQVSEDFPENYFTKGDILNANESFDDEGNSIFVVSFIPQTEVFYGSITNVDRSDPDENSGIIQSVFTLEVDIEDQTIEVESVISTQPDFLTAGYQVGDRVVVNRILSTNGYSFQIVDFVRTTPIFVLVILFVLVTAIVARRKGIMSIGGLILSFVVIFQFILPNILRGSDPLLVTLLGASLMVPINFFLSHGFNRKTLYAGVSTIITLAITGFIAIIFVDWAKLTGYTSDETGFLQALTGGGIDIQALLLAGIIIGVLGILDDITVSQASITQQLKAVNPKIKFNELFFRAMEVGKDHIASLVNTLILVYTSTAMPLLLLFVNANDTFYNTINREVVAQEIVQTLIASIGLILAVPISTAIAAYFFSKMEKVEEDHEHAHHHH